MPVDWEGVWPRAAPRVSAGARMVEVDDPPAVVDLASQKGLALLGYPAARPAQPVARPRLIALLWEESDDKEGRNNPAPLSRGYDEFCPARPSSPSAMRWYGVRPRQPTSEPTSTRLTRWSVQGATLAQLDAAVALYRGSFRRPRRARLPQLGRVARGGAHRVAAARARHHRARG